MNKAERDKLKDQVMDMILTGYTQRATAHNLGIALRSVVSYVKERRAEAIKEMHATADEHMAEMEISQKKRCQKLWTIALDETKKTGDRNKAIQLLQQEDLMSIKRKQIVGLLPAEAPQIAIQNNNMIEGVTTIADSIRRKHPELLEKFNKNKVGLLKEKKVEEIKQPLEIKPWETVEAISSNVLKYSFNQEQNKIRIWFKSSPRTFYEYECTPGTFQSMKKSSSIGSHISSVFKGAKFEKTVEGN